MAMIDDLTERLLQRFKGVPNFNEEDAYELVEESLRVHGFAPSASVPRAQETLLLLYAQAQGAWRIALGAAHYFSFTDGEESVDKSMIADNYRRLARDFQTDYDLERGKFFGNNFRFMRRADRPVTMPPTGESGRVPWRR